MELQTRQPLANHSTIGVGGTADYLAVPKNVGELVEAVEECRKRAIDYVVVGSGSGVLFADKGFRGCVIVTDQMSFIDFRHDRVAVESGANLSEFIKSLVERGLSGLEQLYGIPGTVGGAVYTNAAYFGTSIGAYVDSLIVIDSEGQIRELAKADLGFSRQRGYIGQTILSVNFDLKAFKKAPKEELKKEMESSLHRRAETQPVGLRACRLFENVGGDSIAKMISKSGLRGLKIGRAALWENQPNFLVNLGGAKAADVMMIIKRISDELERRMGVDVELAIQVIGDL